MEHFYQLPRKNERGQETEFEHATRVLELADELGDLVEQLEQRLSNGSLTGADIQNVASSIRRGVFIEVSDLFQLSEAAREYAVRGEVPEE